MKTSIVKVSRYAYEDKKGVFHDGCVISCLLPCVVNKDNVGYDVKEFRTNIELFEKFKALYEDNKPIDLVMEYVPMKNGNYYAKAKSINGIEL